MCVSTLFTFELPLMLAKMCTVFRKLAFIVSETENTLSYTIHTCIILSTLVDKKIIFFWFFKNLKDNWVRWRFEIGWTQVHFFSMYDNWNVTRISFQKRSKCGEIHNERGSNIKIIFWRDVSYILLIFFLGILEKYTRIKG